MTPREEQLADENRQHLLAAETVALALLLRRKRSATDEALRRGKLLPGVAESIADALTGGISQARSLSRIAGASRLQAEALALELESAGLVPVTGSGVATDWYRSRRFALSYARQWLRKANAVEVKSRVAAAALADDATAHALRRTAATESATAYNAGRLAESGRISDVLVQRVWDATLDKRTCPTCREADGTIVGLRDPFPLGEPGAAHPLCRCSWSLVTITSNRREAA